MPDMIVIFFNKSVSLLGCGTFQSLCICD